MPDTADTPAFYVTACRRAATALGVAGRQGPAGIEVLVGMPLPEQVLTHKDTNIDMPALGTALIAAGETAIELGDKDTAPATWAEALIEIAALGKAIKAVVDAAKAYGEAGASVATAPELSELKSALAGLRRPFVEQALAEWLILDLPRVHFALWILGVIDMERIDHPDLPYYLDRQRLDLDTLTKIATDPLEVLGAPFAWGDPAFDPGPIMRLADGLRADHLMSAYGEDAAGNPFYRAGDFIIARTSGNPSPGLQISYQPRASTDVFRRKSLGDAWFVDTVLSATAEGTLTVDVAPPFELSADAQASATGTLAAQIARDPIAGPLRLFGDDTSPVAAWINDPSLTAAVELKAEGAGIAVDFGTIAAADGLTIRVGGDDVDGFIGTLLGSVALAPAFDIEAKWTVKDGLSFNASGGLAMSVPLGIELGPVALNRLSLLLALEDSGALAAAAGIEIGANIGPVKAVVEGIGIQFLMTPDDGAGLPTFKPPTGVGLSVEAGPVKGGGYLSFDHPQGRYAGALELQIGDIGVSAVGLLVTKLPPVNDTPQDGYSLLLLISSSFPPIQLGFGFTLNALGGLLGLHRTVDADALRAGLKAQTLNNIMFPKDPVARAPEIIRDLEGAFPIRQGQHVFGPMAKLGWGTPPLISAELGVVLELDSPLRLIILGKLRAGLPTLAVDPQLAKINMDVLGIIDFDRQEASLDAVLYDSRIAIYTLEGEMAMRLRWGASPFFALAIGGVHPAFERPPELPDLSRIAIGLSAGDRVKLRLEAFLALTSNTVQFGAKLNAHASAMGFTVEGSLGFDALMELDPFRFQVDIRASLSLKRGDETLMIVSLSVKLTGPSPYTISGTAVAKLFFIDVEVPVTAKFGKEEQVQLPLGDPWPALAAALADAGNWRALLPENGTQLVRLRAGADQGEAVHPMGRLGVRQRIVPLGVTLDRFGATGLGAKKHFRIADVAVTVEGDITTMDASQVTFVREPFAPAQFHDMTDDEKLSADSFVPMIAGAAGFGFDGWLAPETDIAAEPAPTTARAIFRRTIQVNGAQSIDPMDDDVMGAALSQQAPSPSARPAPDFGMKDPVWAVVATSDLRRMAAKDNGPFADMPELAADDAHSQPGARAALRAHLTRHPEDRDALRVVALHELEAA